jgi:hypothetical protein
VGLRSGGEGDTDSRRDGVERDEKRLAELGRRTVEMYALAHMFTERLEVRGGGVWGGVLQSGWCVWGGPGGWGQQGGGKATAARMSLHLCLLVVHPQSYPR